MVWANGFGNKKTKSLKNGEAQVKGSKFSFKLWKIP